MRPFKLSTLMEAIKIAEQRFLQARVGGMNEATTYQSNYMEIMERDIGGILGEMVVGRRFDRHYLPAVNTFHGRADVGEDIEVRSTKYANGALILRDNDADDRRYVLVIVDPMQGFEIKGWAWGHEAKTDAWFKNDQGRPAWWYRGELRSVESLTLEIPAEQKEYTW
jgi:hypothetical protein